MGALRRTLEERGFLEVRHCATTLTCRLPAFVRQLLSWLMPASPEGTFSRGCVFPKASLYVLRYQLSNYDLPLWHISNGTRVACILAQVQPPPELYW